MKLLHGSYSKTAPEIKVGAFAMVGGENVFDGIFASGSFDAAGSHGEYVYEYEVNSIAENSDFNENIPLIVDFLRVELDAEENNYSDDELEEIANAIADDECNDDFEDYLNPRMEFANWEMQRLRGRVAAKMGFDAAEMTDEHGTSYIIVNPKITGKPFNEED